MRLELGFEGSEVAAIAAQGKDLHIEFRALHIFAREGGTSEDLSAVLSIPAILVIGQAKYKKLVTGGPLTDGELYGIPGKALNGRIPVQLSLQRDVELELSDAKIDVTIHGKSIHLELDAELLRAEWQKSLKH